MRGDFSNIPPFSIISQIRGEVNVFQRKMQQSAVGRIYKSDAAELDNPTIQKTAIDGIFRICYNKCIRQNHTSFREGHRT